MKINNFFVLVLFAIVAISCSGSSSDNAQKKTAADFINAKWAADEFWDDGQAEVAVYDATREVYGQLRSFDYVYILVKESFNKKFQVKTDDYEQKDLYDVMKVNKFCRIETEAYPYHYLTSVFFKRERPEAVHKLTNTSQEWCGNTAKSFTTEEGDDEMVFDFMSYWDGQGNGTEVIPKEPWFEDQLSYTLRTLKFTDSVRFEIELYPTQITNKADIPHAELATISVEAGTREELDSASAAYTQNSWKVEVARENGPDLTYWFGREYPNYLLQMKSTDGRKLTLKSIVRDDYWSKE